MMHLKNNDRFQRVKVINRYDHSGQKVLPNEGYLDLLSVFVVDGQCFGFLYDIDVPMDSDNKQDIFDKLVGFIALQRLSTYPYLN